MASVWGGARAAAFFTLPAHFILRRLHYHSIASYALGAAAVSVIWPLCMTAAGRVLGSELGSELGSWRLISPEWGAVCLSAMVAGATYRAVAGGHS
jgi:hypothetical protein